MSIEKIMLELLGAGLIGGVSFVVSQFYTIAPFDRSWTKETNTILFCGFPVCVYLMFRLYFGIVFFATSKIPSKFEIIGKVCNFIFVTGGIGFALYQPKVVSTITLLYNTYVGELPVLLLELSRPSIDKAYVFGLKILGLLFGWFVLLFCVELVLRVLVLMLGFVLRNTVYRGREKENDSGSKSRLKEE